MRDKVVIGYCHGGMIHQPFAAAIMQFIHWDGQHRQLLDGFIHVGGLYIDDNRNRLVEQFLRLDDNWLLILDTDIIFPPDALDLLIDAADPVQRPIVSALYFGFMDGANIAPIWLNENEKGEFVSLERLAVGQLQELGAVGMGCVLIHRSVFEKMAEAYADDPWHWFGRDIGYLDGKATRLGEDLTFCKRARALGFTIWGDSRIPVQHIKQRILTIDTFVNEKLGDPAARLKVKELTHGQLCEKNSSLAAAAAGK